MAVERKSGGKNAWPVSQKMEKAWCNIFLDLIHIKIVDKVKLTQQLTQDQYGETCVSKLPLESGAKWS